MDYTDRIMVESKEKWHDFQKTMPFIELKEGWKFRVTPAFGGAIFRFRIMSPNSNEYSIYFDAFERIGIYGSPYYEIYEIAGDVFRSDDIDEILDVMYSEEKSRTTSDNQ